MRGDERRVVDAFCAWLDGDGWNVEREIDFVDVRATRGGEKLLAEAKGRTTSPGLDIDTMFGQLLRRMTTVAPAGVRYAVVVPESSVRAVQRVKPDVLAALAIDVYAVSDDGAVRQVL